MNVLRSMRAAIAAAWLVCSLLPIAAAQDTAPAAYDGLARVTGVADGDTVYVRLLGYGGPPLRLRLADIDAPEKKQAFGRRSEQSLRELAGGKDVRASWRALDVYGRPIAQISVDGLNVNAEQVRRGMAWVFRRYSRDPALIELERLAREERIGLWADAQPVAPWEWRAQQRAGVEP